jgi:DNA-binding transcriptional LysR family regulator
LLERSTRSLRLTEIGSEVLQCAQQSAEVNDAVDQIVSKRRSSVSGTLRLSAPPSIADSLVVPLVSPFQASYPNVSVQILFTERVIDHIVDGVDLVFRIGELRDSALIARTILTYRHLLLASPTYLDKHKPPKTPPDLLGHRLLTFSHWRPESSWNFVHVNGKDKETVTFQPYLSMNDFAGILHALLAGVGIGDLPPLVRPELVREGRLVEVLPKWHFRTLNLSLVHLGNRYLAPPVRLFRDFAAEMAPKIIGPLPR